MKAIRRMILALALMALLEVGQYAQIAAHAFKEGEGDRSLAYWREIHSRFFGGCLKEIGRTFEETMDVVCEEFEVVYTE